MVRQTIARRPGVFRTLLRGAEVLSVPLGMLSFPEQGAVPVDPSHNPYRQRK